uniref:PBSX family phage terminase large subunit n=1 Tax=Enterocloster aldenensis TaxID=358742 RepID=UPI00336A6381
MGINERIAQMKERIQRIKEKRNIITKLQVFKFKPFSTKQKQILTWWMPSSPVKDYDGIIADGAIRSGKTVCMSLSFVFWAMKTFSGQNFAICGKTIGSFRRNVLFWLKIMLRSRGYKVMDHRADNLVEISRNGVTNYFYIFGGKDERSQDLIQGITLAGLFCDEVALMPESFVNQATGRCSVDGSKYWFNCNPDGPYHWFKTNWIDRSVGYLGKAEVERQMKEAKEKKQDISFKKLLYVHFTMDDNLSLSEEIKARYRDSYSGVFYKRYILGLWAMAEGIIYDMFDVDKHVKKVIANLYNSGRYVSIDYGTQNATVFLLWNRGVDGKWYCIREYYYSGRDNAKQRTDAEYVKDFKAFLGGMKVKAVIVDPSAASFIAALRQAGYPVLKAKNDVEDGIRLVGTLLNQEKIVFSAACVNTIKEFASYIWDAKAADRGEDAPIKQHDHAMDAVRYFCYMVLNNQRAKIKNKSSYGFY